MFEILFGLIPVGVTNSWMFHSSYSRTFDLCCVLWALVLFWYLLLEHVSSYLSQREICCPQLSSFLSKLPICSSLPPMLLFVTVHHKEFSNHLVRWSFIWGEDLPRWPAGQCSIQADNAASLKDKISSSVFRISSWTQTIPGCLMLKAVGWRERCLHFCRL